MIDICGQISYNYSNLFQKKQVEVLSLNSYFFSGETRKRGNYSVMCCIRQKSPKIFQK